jgi:hypothetical protein
LAAACDVDDVWVKEVLLPLLFSMWSINVFSIFLF